MLFFFLLSGLSMWAEISTRTFGPEKHLCSSLLRNAHMCNMDSGFVVRFSTDANEK